MPHGMMVTYWFVVICKYLLQNKMPVAKRLRVSELLDNQKQSGFYGLPEQIIATLQPAGAAEVEIFNAACKANSPDERGKASFEILGSGRMFDLLTLANPSVLEAIKADIAHRKGGVVEYLEPSKAEQNKKYPAQFSGAMSAAQFAHTQRRMNGHNGVTPHRSHYPPNQINRVGGDLPDWTFDIERGNET